MKQAFLLLNHWERAGLVLILGSVFLLGAIAGVYTERRNWQAKAGRCAYFLTRQILADEHTRANSSH